MAVCTKCQIEYEEGKRFCRFCGDSLSADAPPPSSVEEKSPSETGTGWRFVCPRCRTQYEIGNYCKTCGIALVREDGPHEPIHTELRKSPIRSLSREWQKIFQEREEIESCLKQLETQRDKVSPDVFDHLLNHYQDQLRSLSSRYQELKTELESIKRRASDEIDALERTLEPVRKKLQEFRFLYKSGAMKRTDFVREKTEIEKEIKARERQIKEHRKMTSLPPEQARGNAAFYRKIGPLLRPLPLAILGGIVIVTVGGAYLLQPRPLPSGGSVPSEAVSTAVTPSPADLSTASPLESQETEKIKAILENIRQANLQKNIDLFMSSYSPAFKDREAKRLATLETWKTFNYLDLKYDLKRKTISGNTATVRVEWWIRIFQPSDGKPQDSKAVLDVLLKKEDGHWKIREIRSIS
jgi:ketosteroid isomerase-like protein